MVSIKCKYGDDAGHKGRRVWSINFISAQSKNEATAPDISTFMLTLAQSFCETQ